MPTLEMHSKKARRLAPRAFPLGAFDATPGRGFRQLEEPLNLWDLRSSPVPPAMTPDPFGHEPGLAKSSPVEGPHRIEIRLDFSHADLICRSTLEPRHELAYKTSKQSRRDNNH